MPQFISRMIRAARLDTTLYDEVKTDTTTMKQAIGIVFLTFVASVSESISKEGFDNVPRLLAGLAFWFIAWFVSSFALYFVGTEFTGEERTRFKAVAMLRTVAFSLSPFIIHILRVVPELSVLIKIVTVIWVWAATVVAVRRTLDIRSIGQTIGIFVIGGMGGIIILFVILFTVFAPFMP